MFRCFLINFNYFLDGEFATLEEAIARGKAGGFEFSVWRVEAPNAQSKVTDERLVASWSPLYGLRHHASV